MENNYTSKVNEDLKDTFKLLDGDNDNLVTVKEIGLLVKTLNHMIKDDDIKELSKELNQDELTLNMFESFWKLKLSDGSNYQNLNDYDTLFSFFDTDRNELIDARDLIEGLEKLGLDITPDEADEMILEADLDGDRLLNINDFSRMISLILN